MKKALKIIGISLLSIISLIIIAVVIAFSVVTSSNKLTDLVKKYVPEFVTCEVQLGKADLTIFKTFPNIGVEIDNVALINPMEGSPSDTLANIDKLIMSADLKKFWKEDEIVVRKCVLEKAFVNVYSDENGNSNLNVFKTSENSDTAASSFNYLVNLEEVKLKDSKVVYTDARSEMRANVEGLNLDLKGNMKDSNIDADLGLETESLALNMKSITLKTNSLSLDFDGNVNDFKLIDGTLKLATPDICLNLGEEYLNNDALNLTLPLHFSLDNMSGTLQDAQIALNEYLINLAGDVEMAENGDINMDLNLHTNTLIVEDVMNYLPQKVANSLSDLNFAGKLSIAEAQVKGTFNDSLMPLITAKVLTDKASMNISNLPYPFTDVDLEALLDLNLNEKSNVEVSQLTAKFHDTKLNVSGFVNDLTDDMSFDLNAKADLPMADIKSFLPKNMKVQGRTDVDLNAKFTLEQLMKSLKDYNLNRLTANGTLKIKNFAFDMDTIHANAQKLDVNLTLPASRKIKGRKGAYLALASGNLTAQIGKDMNAKLKDFALSATADDFAGEIGKMNLNADLNFSKLDFVYDTIQVNANSPSITFVTIPSKQKPKDLNARVTFDSKQLDANMGKAYQLNTESLKVAAAAHQDKTKDDFLNKWNPEADFSLKNAEVQVDGIDETIYVPNIDFLFNSHELGFKKSTVKIGQSDMSLEGNVVGIKEWIADNNNMMKGELQLTSDFLNINELMDLTSGLGSDPDSLAMDETANKEDNPFIVPKGVDFYFGVKTKNAVYDNFDLNNLGGQLTVKDGTLILQEIGFTNKAAVMQLTAMYRSPRKNHLFLGMDFHLLDVQINDLLTMIPYIDTVVPMLRTFDGQAEFHIAAETYLKSNYQPKVSTMRAAADIEGQNLTVNDQLSFTKITDMLGVSTDGNYKIDSLDMQMTVFKDQVDLYPFMISIGKYKAVASGRQNLDKTCSYHISVTDSPLPTRLGLDISGSLGNLKFALAPCKYKNLYRPERRSDTENMTLELKKKIAASLKDNVL